MPDPTPFHEEMNARLADRLQQPTDNVEVSNAAISEIQTDQASGNVDLPATPNTAGGYLPDAANVIDEAQFREELDHRSPRKILASYRTIDVTPPPGESLGAENANRGAVKLREALDRRDIFGRPDPDLQRVRDLMNVSGPHGDQMRAAYKALEGRRSLTDDINAMERFVAARTRAMPQRIGLPLGRN